jgi:PKD repeat protein
MKHLLSLLFLSLFYFTAFAQEYLPSQESSDELLNRRGEVFFRFASADLQGHPELFSMISLDKVSKDEVFAYANKKEFTAFRDLGISYTVLIPPSEMIDIEMADSPQQVLEWNYYPTYSQYESIMADFAANYPDITQLIEIGTLASGRKILALRITDHPDIQENEPEFFYTSSMHGDELTGYPMMLHLIDLLLTSYGTDTRLTNIVNNTDIYINPLANPDGTYHGGNNTVYGATRGNANGIDFNRNFPDPEPLDPGNPGYDHMHPDGNAWQPETILFMNFAASRNLTLSANFHGGAEVLNYPWDTWARLTPDNSWWVHVCRQYADTVHKYCPAGYLDDLDNGITDGYAWYRITGGRQDYHNYFVKEREVTIELSNTKLIPTSQIIPHWNYNFRSLINFLDQSHYGIGGIVTDSMSGEPLYAKIFINSHDADSSFIYTDPSVGDYHRLIKAGTYSVTYSAPGYQSKTYDLTITDNNLKIQNVQLYDGSITSNFTANKTNVPVAATVQFQDQSAGNPVSWQWYFDGGIPETSTDKNPVIVYNTPGQYDVSLKVTRSDGSDSLTKEGYITVQPWYMIANKTYEVCQGIFLDEGGMMGSYANSSDYWITLKPDAPYNRLKIHFNTLNIEQSSNCTADRLIVFNGADLTDPVIGTYCGTDEPADIISLNADNALSFRFISNNNNTASGWDASISCISTVGIDLPQENSLIISPNPSIDGNFRLSAAEEIELVTLTNTTGQVLITDKPYNQFYTIDLSNKTSGIYIVTIKTRSGTLSGKLVRL